ncbi:hypothetical protein JCGZ_12321 [Jatropha curcas]|uniref:glucan endo-1,3-beta-D-glucosidase n=1 Tax=Jatropha curcas TaxID=180498 RepID=A0A067KHX2_JATCU|nr:hypothetical protein JCGZ_12321 [Jatropha curcas]
MVHSIFSLLAAFLLSIELHDFAGIQVILGAVDNDLPTLATNPTFATTWSFLQCKPYKIIAANLTIPISTAIFQQTLSVSYPPSAGSWSSDASPYIIPVAQFLQANKYPLLCNVYTYFSYQSDPEHIRLDYALINTSEVTVQDGSLGYTNLLDASIDAIYAALEKVGANDVEIIVSETGWPSGGPDSATTINAQTYNNNVIARLANVGTPKRPGQVLESYIFALFNEDLNSVGIEQHFGLFYLNLTEVYPVNF